MFGFKNPFSLNDKIEREFDRCKRLSRKDIYSEFAEYKKEKIDTALAKLLEKKIIFKDILASKNVEEETFAHKSILEAYYLGRK